MDNQAINKGWRTFFIITHTFLAICLLAFIFFMNTGGVGGGIAAFIVEGVAAPALIINAVGLLIYLMVAKPRKQNLALTLTSLILSIIIGGYTTYSVVGQYIIPRMQADSDYDHESTNELRANNDAYRSTLPKTTQIEPGYATAIIKNCKVKEIYYTSQNQTEDKDQGFWGEISKTGIVATRVDGEETPSRISLSEEMVAKIIPVAREANCKDLRIWHDGQFEN